MSEQYCLNWNNFNTTFSSGLFEYLDSDELTDVVLDVEGSTIQAHKLVLSLCSPYFKNLFQGVQSYHVPYVVLKDVKHSEMKAILNFIYKGEVNLNHDELKGFLRTGQQLQIKGLCQMDLQESEDANSTENNVSQNTNQETSEKNVLPELATVVTETKSSPDSHKVKLSDSLLTPPSDKPPAPPLLEINSTFNTLHKKSKRKRSEDLDSASSSQDYKHEYNCVTQLEEDTTTTITTAKVKRSAKPLKEKGKISGRKTEKCNQCDRVFVNNYNLRIHIRDKHSKKDAVKVQCGVCSKWFSNPSCLRVHYGHHRKEMPVY